MSNNNHPNRSLTLRRLQDRATVLRHEFAAMVAREFPGRVPADWYRAVEHSKPNPIARPNDDTSQDAAMAAHEGLKRAHDAYIAALHEYYSLRDGPRGFLGGRGL